MIALAARAAAGLLLLAAAVVAPYSFAAAGDLNGMAIALAAGVPLAAMAIAAAIIEHDKWAAERLALRAWSRLEHPANARPHPLAAPVAAPVANPLVDPVDAHAAQVIALHRIGRHDPEALAAPTRALPAVRAAS
jgi:hypothetical protein